MAPQFRALQPETINRALLNLRAQIIREDDPGLKHVEALLRLRGVKLPPVPVWTVRRFRRNELRRAILAELRSGPLTAKELAARIAAKHGDMLPEDVLRGVRDALTTMRDKGLVRNGGGLWWLPN